MLRVYTRHYPPCAHTDFGYRRCHCPKWINGNLPTGEFVRVSAQTRSWENAERKARLMEVNADPLRQALPDSTLRITIEQAVRDFLQDEQARQLVKTTTCQSKTLFEQQLLPWAKAQSLIFLDELTTAKLRDFRASWKNGGLTTQRKHHRRDGFFDFSKLLVLLLDLAVPAAMPTMVLAGSRPPGKKLPGLLGPAPG